jgi:3-hydroxybutyryl-CoA dehydrogenase
VNSPIPTTIALIGATPIAGQIATRALRAGINVIIDDISDARLQSISTQLRSVTLPANLLLTQSIDSAIRAADFLIDTLPDDLEVKLELFTLFDKFAKPNAIFITTGTIPIDDLAGITFCPDRCIAVRIAPSETNNLNFEPIPGSQTSPETIASTTALFEQLK